MRFSPFSLSVLFVVFSLTAPAAPLRVAVAGLGTNKDTKDIFSKGGSGSWAWDGIGNRYGNVYLTYYEATPELKKTVSASRCKGMVLVVNSWGARKSKKLATMYKEKCGKPVDLLIMIDGVSHPSPLPWTQEIPAKVCVNLYQHKKTSTVLHGAAMDNCFNHEIKFDDEEGDGHLLIGDFGARESLRMITKLGY